MALVSGCIPSYKGGYGGGGIKQLVTSHLTSGSRERWMCCAAHCLLYIQFSTLSRSVQDGRPQDITAHISMHILFSVKSVSEYLIDTTRGVSPRYLWIQSSWRRRRAIIILSVEPACQSRALCSRLWKRMLAWTTESHGNLGPMHLGTEYSEAPEGRYNGWRPQQCHKADTGITYSSLQGKRCYWWHFSVPSKILFAASCKGNSPVI